ncbi:MAG: cobalt ECF transporter T component CbiQ [Actinobacteria bacterium]|jgi:cobalt/nickel transport system permease protein|nr:cobalt ECF transporter T component CbiQ [Actinomycetota bacterium]
MPIEARIDNKECRIMGNFNLSVRDKLIIVFINIIFIVSIAKGRYAVMALFGFLALFVMILFKPDYRRMPRRIFTVFLYPLFVSIFIPFINPGNILAELDLRLLTITITDNGLTTFITVLIKSFLSILLVASLMLSTDEKELFYGLRKIKVPGIMVSIMFLMYRYIFLIREESRAGQMAINARIFKRSHYAVNRKLAYLMGNLFIKSFDRAENIYKSMESRGFTGEFHITGRTPKSSNLSIAFLLTFIIIPATIKIVELARIV